MEKPWETWLLSSATWRPAMKKRALTLWVSKDRELRPMIWKLQEAILAQYKKVFSKEGVNILCCEVVVFLSLEITSNY